MSSNIEPPDPTPAVPPQVDPADLARDMRRWSAVSHAVMLPADVVDQWADAIDTLTEDNEALRKATRLHGVSGPLLQAVVSDRPERCLYCEQPAAEFSITCDAHTGRRTSLADRIRAMIEHTPPGSRLTATLSNLADDADDRETDTRRREATWTRLYTSMKRQRNAYRTALADRGVTLSPIVVEQIAVEQQARKDDSL